MTNRDRSQGTGPDDDHPLAPLGRAVVPDLDASARDRIEASLRVRHADASPSPRRGVGWRFVVPALLLVAIVAVAVFALGDEPAVAAFEIRDADEVTVILPDGEAVIDPDDGFTLVDGARVVVGDGGQVTIDDVTLGPGASVTVRGDQLVSDVVATTTSNAPSTTVPPTTVPPAVPSTTVTSTTGAPTTAPPTPTTSEPLRSTTTTAPPTTTTVTRPVDVEPVRDGEDADALAIGLRVAARDGAARIVWSVRGPLDPEWNTVVVRTADGSEPTNENGTVVAQGATGELTETRDDVGAGATVLRYRVLVRDGNGGVVAGSVVQTLGR